MQDILNVQEGPFKMSKLQLLPAAQPSVVQAALQLQNLLQPLAGYQSGQQDWRD